MTIQGKKTSSVKIEIPYSSIQKMSYGQIKHHRIMSGAAVMPISPGLGAIIMASKSKSNYLIVDYVSGETRESLVLRIDDRGGYLYAISTFEANTGKQVELLSSNLSLLDPAIGSKDVDEVVPFDLDAVATALKPSMVLMGCNVTVQLTDRIECQRKRGNSARTGIGGERIIATLDAQGPRTRVRIQTFKTSLRMKNWSTPIYQELKKDLQAPPAASETPVP